LAFVTLPNEHRKPIRATAFDGKSLHLKRRTQKDNPSWKVDVAHNLLDEIPDRVQAADSSSRRIGSLLDAPIHRLVERLSAKTSAQLDRW
jgi:hypothetical protein